MDLRELMDSSVNVADLKISSSNRLHRLDGERKNSWRVTVRDGWCIVFKFENRNYLDVQILDYHEKWQEVHETEKTQSLR